MSHLNIASDRYVIDEEIGRGGMGVVLKAHDKLLDIPVAIKFLSSDFTGTGAARLQREAQAAGKLSHPNIAKILDFGQTEDGTPYMVMEFIDGQSLADLIKKDTRVELKKAINIFIQIASAISYAHSNGIIHRDLKPSNVLLMDSATSACQAKLLDFGVARIVHIEQSLTHTGAIVGSPLYMSPEQSEGDTTSNSDIYSFGCLMFEALTGEVPFKGKSVLETISMHRNTAPPLLTDFISVQKLPNDLVMLVDECLRKSPKFRPETMMTVVDRLRIIQEKIENSGVSPELIQKISRQYFKIKLIQFWKSKFGLLTVVAVVCALIGLSFSVSNSEHKREIETKNVTKRSVVENPLLKDNSMLSPKGTIGRGLRLIQSSTRPLVNADNSVTDGDLIVLKDKKIASVYLDHGAFDGSGLKYLNSDFIDFLSIKNSGLKPENLKYVAKMKSLRTLQIGSQFITDQALAYLKDLHSLDYLYLCSDKITDSGIRYLEGLPLQELSVQSTGITNNVTSSLQKMSNLQKLHLLKTSIGPDIGIRLSPLKNLNELHLSGTSKISPASIKAISKLNLTSLGLDGVEIEENDFKKIAEIKSLQTLVLGSARFNTKDLGYLASLPNLRYIDFLNSSQIDDDLIASLESIKSLRRLDFNDSNITEKQMLKLTRLRYLEHLEVLNTNISETSFDLFKETFRRIWKKDIELEGSEKL